MREREGNIGQTLANKNSFPTVESFLALWNIIEAKYQLSAEEKNKITSRAMARVKEEFNIEKQQREFVNFYQLPL